MFPAILYFSLDCFWNPWWVTPFGILVPHDWFIGALGPLVPIKAIPIIFRHLYCVRGKKVNIKTCSHSRPFNLHLDFWKSRSVSNLIKIPVPVHLIFFSVHLNFFSVCHLNFFQVYGTNLKKIQLTNWKKFWSTEKKFRCAGPEIFLRF